MRFLLLIFVLTVTGCSSNRESKQDFFDRVKVLNGSLKDDDDVAKFKNVQELETALGRPADSRIGQDRESWSYRFNDGSVTFIVFVNPGYWVILDRTTVDLH